MLKLLLTILCSLPFSSLQNDHVILSYHVVFLRCASMAERRVNMDQRRTENTQSANRQSDLEKEYKIGFRDGKRVDAIDLIEAKLNKTRKTKQLNADDQLKTYRLACYIFEVLSYFTL